MNTKSDLAQIILTLPKEEHKKFKSNVAAMGKTMKQVLLEAIESINKQECPYENLPFNKETESALKNILENKNLVKVKNVKELFKKAGIKC